MNVLPLRIDARKTAILAGAFLGALAPSLAGCGDPDLFLPSVIDLGGKRGVIDGNVVYTGPAPCTRDGKILGAAVILAFETHLLPPPEGLGTTAASLDVVPGEALFAGLRDKLAFASDGSTICGDPGDPVTVSGSWAVGPFTAGTYQIRGFYDKYGDFDPAFSISNLPSKGDVGGGAVREPFLPIALCGKPGRALRQAQGPGLAPTLRVIRLLFRIRGADVSHPVSSLLLFLPRKPRP